MIFKKRTLVLFSIVVILSNIFCGCNLLPKEEQALAPPLVKPKQEQYETVKVQRGEVALTLHGQASFVCKNENTLFFKDSSKRLKSINVHVGDSVKKGTILAQIDGNNSESVIKIEEYIVEKAKIKYEQAQRGSDADATELSRLDYLIESTKLQDLKTQYEQCNLISPIDGIVVFVENVKEGDMVEAYKPIVVVGDPSKLQLYYKSGDAEKSQIGMKAKIKFNNEEYNGTVVASTNKNSMVKDDAIEKFLKIDADSDIPGVKFGDEASIEVILEKKENVLYIPISAIEMFPGYNKVQILNGKSKKEVEVKVGLEGDKYAEIVSGVSEGQDVILK